MFLHVWKCLDCLQFSLQNLLGPLNFPGFLGICWTFTAVQLTPWIYDSESLLSLLFSTEDRKLQWTKPVLSFSFKSPLGGQGNHSIFAFKNLPWYLPEVVLQVSIGYATCKYCIFNLLYYMRWRTHVVKKSLDSMLERFKKLPDYAIDISGLGNLIMVVHLLRFHHCIL